MRRDLAAVAMMTLLVQSPAPANVRQSVQACKSWIKGQLHISFDNLPKYLCQLLSEFEKQKAEEGKADQSKAKAGASSKTDVVEPPLAASHSPNVLSDAKDDVSVVASSSAASSTKKRSQHLAAQLLGKKKC